MDNKKRKLGNETPPHGRAVSDGTSRRGAVAFRGPLLQPPEGQWWLRRRAAFPPPPGVQSFGVNV